MIALFVAGLAVWLYLPIRRQADPPANRARDVGLGLTRPWDLYRYVSADPFQDQMFRFPRTEPRRQPPGAWSGQSALESVKPGALVLGHRLEITPLRYLQIVDGRRPGVELLNAFLDLNRLKRELGSRGEHDYRPSEQAIFAEGELPMLQRLQPDRWPQTARRTSPRATQTGEHPGQAAQIDFRVVPISAESVDVDRPGTSRSGPGPGSSRSP